MFINVCCTGYFNPFNNADVISTSVLLVDTYRLILIQQILMKFLNLVVLSMAWLEQENAICKSKKRGNKKKTNLFSFTSFPKEINKNQCKSAIF